MEVIKKDVEEYSIMVYVKGFDKKTYVMYTDDSETGDQFLKRYLEKANMPITLLPDLRIILKGKMLFGEHVLGTYGINREDTLNIMKLDRGGAPTPWSATPKPKQPSLNIF